VRPLAMSNRSVGGGDWLLSGTTYPVQKGITGASGLNNTGMLVTTCGKIVSFQPLGGCEHAGLLTIDDGSTPGGISCLIPTNTVVDPSWTYVTVTGISSCQVSQDHRKVSRLLRIRQQSDIIVVK